MARSHIYVLALLLSCNVILAEQREILIDEGGSIYKVNKHEEYESDDAIDEVEHGPCHLEYQVVKRVVGTCIKLGRTARGCVAGNYLHPDHPECM